MIDKKSNLVKPLFYAIAFLVIVELLMHFQPVQKVIPLPNPYYHPEVETKFRALKKLLDNESEINVLFIGSSSVRADISPLIFDNALKKQFGRKVVSFNGGLSGLSIAPVMAYLQNFWFKHGKPDIVVQGIRYEELTNDIHLKDSPLKEGKIEPNWWEINFLKRLKLIAYQNSMLVYYMGFLKDYLLDPLWPPNSIRGHIVDEKGYEARAHTLSETIAEANIKNIKVPGKKVYNGAFTPEAFTSGLNSLENIYQLCNDKGVRYVIVNIPEHGYKYQNRGLKRYNAYLKQVKHFANRHGLLFIDLTNGDPLYFSEDRYFSDYNHMNIEGAALFTEGLAQKLGEYSIFIER